MTQTPQMSFQLYRRHLLLRILLVAIAASIVLKFANVLATYPFQSSGAYLEDVPGMSLAKFARSVAWENAIAIGLLVSLSAVAAMALITLIDRAKIHEFLSTVSDSRVLNRELSTYLVLLAAASLLASGGIVAAGTIGAQNFLPLTAFALLNPDWGQRHLRARTSSAILLGLTGFVLGGSKTIIFNLLLAVALNAFYNRNRRWLAVALVLVFVIIYPYLNIFRGLASTVSTRAAFLATMAQFSAEFGASGPMQMLFSSYGAILDRLVGLDGLIVATTFTGQTDLSSQDIAYALVGYVGIGISFGLLGQLYLSLGDIGLVAAIFPIVALATWRVVIILDTHLTALGFASFGTFLYIKAIQMLIGGFRWVDVKLTLTTILVVLAYGLILYMFRSTRRGAFVR